MPPKKDQLRFYDEWMIENDSINYIIEDFSINLHFIRIRRPLSVNILYFGISKMTKMNMYIKIVKILNFLVFSHQNSSSDN